MGDAILLGLREIKARRLFASLGFASLFEMLVKHFGLSESSAYVRLNALKLMKAVPEAQSEIFTGRLSLSNAAQVQRFIQRTEKESAAPMPIEKKKEVMAAVCGKSHKQAQATEVLKRLAKTAVPVLRKARGREMPKTLPAEKSTSDANKLRVNSRNIRREIKRAVFMRSEGQCEYIGPNGRRCESRHQFSRQSS